MKPFPTTEHKYLNEGKETLNKPIYFAAENEDGTVYYDIKLRDDLVYSDGEPMTIDDVIFNMYVLCDPTYDGSSTLFSQPIEGLEEYRSGMDTLFNLMFAAGKDNTDFALWDEATQKQFWEDLDAGAVALAQDIVDFCIANGYNEEGSTTTPFEMLRKNMASRYDLAIDIAKVTNRDDLATKYEDILAQNHSHATQFGVDLIK